MVGYVWKACVAGGVGERVLFSLYGRACQSRRRWGLLACFMARAGL